MKKKKPGSGKPTEPTRTKRVVQDQRVYIERLKKEERTLRAQALHDPLTALFNRRYLEEVLEREFSRATRGRLPVGVVMADIDHFKRVNDRFGHDCGDDVLRGMAAALTANVRKSDIVCRFGGEEFTIVLPGTTAERTLRRAEQLRQSIRKLALDCGGAPLGPITMSFGIAVFPIDGKTPQAVLKAADKALLRAKRGGRNRAVMASAAAGTLAARD